MAAILKDEPEPLPEGVPLPVQALVRRCLEKRPEDRFGSARDLAFALQTLIEAAPRTAAKLPDEERPYPGLAAFAETDAKRFFGRDEEIVALWRKIPTRSLLALIGPSGVGKTSFIRAGLVPHAPPGWRCIVATPGQAPFAALARALAPFFSGDTEAVQQLLEFHVPETAIGLVQRWKQRADHGLIVVDQFEELFTLNPEDLQARFADLLAKLAALDGIHVVLSMRDDFFFSCHRLAPLKDIFLDVTPLGPPSAEGLRNALVEPAKSLGFAFEDEALVDEMVHAVEGERGALPMLAFAAASLWERRDLEAKKLTRAAYDAVGGAEGALAQHAEATLERIGTDKLPLVRELFRNLTTSAPDALRAGRRGAAVGVSRGRARRCRRRARAARRCATAHVVRGARPRTASRHDRVELVHESLLTAWPRLVRWRTEDEGGAQLRDQLRQAAHLWDEKGRPEDLLWTGTSYQEYQVWRARYPGGLSAVEEAFGRVMTELAGRRRRRRRIAVAVALVVVSAAAAALGFLLRRSRQETRRAEAEVAQREAGQLLALGRVRLADSPNAALAYATASIDRADNAPARRLAVEALWQGPSALFLKEFAGWELRWSPDGHWLAVGDEAGFSLLERGVSGGRRLGSEASWPRGFTADGRWFVELAGPAGAPVPRVWSLPEGRLERTVELPEATHLWVVGERLLTLTRVALTPQGERSYLARVLTLDGSTDRELGLWRVRRKDRAPSYAVDPTGTCIAWTQEGRVLAQQLDALTAPARVIGEHEGETVLKLGRGCGQAITSDGGGEVRIWDLASSRRERTLRSPADAMNAAFDPAGRFVATAPWIGVLPPRSMFLFDLAAPRMAEPAPLLESDLPYINHLVFSPDGLWLAGVHGQIVLLWNMTGPRSLVLGRESSAIVRFADDGHLLSGGLGGALRRWPLDPGATEGVEELWSRQGAQILSMDVDPGGRLVAVNDEYTGKNLIVPLDEAKVPGFEPRSLPGSDLLGAGFGWDPSGRFLAMAVYAWGRPEANAIRIFDRETGAERTLDTRAGGATGCEEAGSQNEGGAAPLWLRDGRLLSDGDGGLREWDLATGTSSQLRPCKDGMIQDLLATPDSRAVVRLDSTGGTAAVLSLSVFDLGSRTTREITSHGGRVSAVALDPSGTILVTGDKTGVVRVGPLDGSEPRLLFGHTGAITSVAVSPDGRRIASGSADGTIRLWPMPDLSKAPLNTLPHDELLAKLRALTNLRAVRDPASDTGWKIEVGPFPGWAEVPMWQP